MLDGILGRGFASKCKSLIKLTKTRIDGIRRKKKATLKFLKKDIADLLSNGLEINAYGRAEGLLAELTISSCYDFVEQSCDIVIANLPIMQKQRECPEECREAIASLMFAAARFSDLPELRELRQIFQERFETSLDHLENKKFVENLAAKPSTLEKKVQLLQDIALEFSIKWDSVAFEKRMSTPPAYAQGPPKDFGSSNAAVEKTSSHVKQNDPRGKDGASYKASFEHANGGHRSLNPSDSTISERKEDKFRSRQELPGNGHEKVYGKEESILKIDVHENGGHRFLNPSDSTVSERKEVKLRSRREFIGNGHEKVYDKKESILKIDGHENHYGEKKRSSVSKHEATNGMLGSAFRTGRVGSSSSSEILGDADDMDDRKRTVPDYLKFLPSHNPGATPTRAGSQINHDIKEPSSGNTHAGRTGYVDLPGKAEEDKYQKLKPSHNSTLPPPYVKANFRRKDRKDGDHLELPRAGNDNNCISTDPQKHVGSEMTTGIFQFEPCHFDRERQITSPTKENSHVEKEKDNNPFGARLPLDTLPKPRSVRRRHHKPRSSHPVDNAEDTGVGRKKSRSSRRDDKRGLQLLVDEEDNERDEEERIIDKLLIHYSKKPSSFEPEKMRRKPRSHLAPENDPLNRTRDRPDEQANIPPPIIKPRGHLALENDTNVAAPLIRRRDRPDEQANRIPPPARSVSLPREHMSSPETSKVFSRVASFQPDRSNAAKHVHPKLPDYDDLAARFAALRGR